MKMKLRAELIKEKATEYLDMRSKRINTQYENAIFKAMQPSIWNLWKGRDREKAIRHLDNWGVDSPMYGSYLGMLEWKGSYYSHIVEDALKMSNLAISNGQEFVWISDEELFFIED